MALPHGLYCMVESQTPHTPDRMSVVEDLKEALKASFYTRREQIPESDNGHLQRCSSPAIDVATLAGMR